LRREVGDADEAGQAAGDGCERQHLPARVVDRHPDGFVRRLARRPQDHRRERKPADQPREQAQAEPPARDVRRGRRPAGVDGLKCRRRGRSRRAADCEHDDAAGGVAVIVGEHPPGDAVRGGGQRRQLEHQDAGIAPAGRDPRARHRAPGAVKQRSRAEPGRDVLAEPQRHGPRRLGEDRAVRRLRADEDGMGGRRARRQQDDDGQRAADAEEAEQERQRAPARRVRRP
jgi:hypothetical protein